MFAGGRRQDPAGQQQDDFAARFRTQILPHLDAAYNYARYLARDGTAAEDIVQEAFLRAWKGFGACRGSPRPWLLTIVRNCYHDWSKANRRYVVDDELAVQECLDASAEGAEDRALQALDVATLRETITRLPEPFRETLVLRELEDLSYREIAVLTATPIGTVMSRLARGRDMLARVLLKADNKGATGS